jgi:hypothetical protein
VEVGAPPPSPSRVPPAGSPGFKSSSSVTVALDTPLASMVGLPPGSAKRPSAAAAAAAAAAVADSEFAEYAEEEGGEEEEGEGEEVEVEEEEEEEEEDEAPPTPLRHVEDRWSKIAVGGEKRVILAATEHQVSSSSVEDVTVTTTMMPEPDTDSDSEL